MPSRLARGFLAVCVTGRRTLMDGTQAPRGTAAGFSPTTVHAVPGRSGRAIGLGR